MASSSSRIKRHAWEMADAAEPDVHAPAPHPWEVEADIGDAPAEGDEGDDLNTDTVEGAAALFIDMLLDLHFMSKLSAYQFCVLCHYAKKAGMTGDVQRYGKAPGDRSIGHYQRHLNTQLGLDGLKQTHYIFQAPGQQRHEIGRPPVNFRMALPHEVVEGEYEGHGDMPKLLAEAKASGKLPPCYDTHPIVTSNPDTPVVPLSVYMDGVAYSEIDTVVGIWIINLLTGLRHLVGLVRKRLTRKCGCKGWDTYFPVMSVLRWSLACLARGENPSCRHNGDPWDASDGQRIGKSNSPLACKAAVLFLKGDWAEFVERFGFPNWQSVMRPCFLCASPPDQLYDLVGSSPGHLPFRVNEDVDYDTACRRCEIRTTISREQHGRLKGILRFDKRDQGSKGLALTRPFPELGLHIGDRVEPTATLEDVGKFDAIDTFPCDVLFWRLAEETMCQRRCPLFDADIGILPASSIALDLLHTMNLGCMMTFVHYAVWFLLQAKIWGGSSKRPSTSSNW